MTQCPDALDLRQNRARFSRRPERRRIYTTTPMDPRSKTLRVWPVVRFAYGLQKDISAIAAAVETSWSTGQVEGQINRLKTIKRQMYGRAGFELLRARVLPYSPAASTGPAP